MVFLLIFLEFPTLQVIVEKIIYVHVASWRRQHPTARRIFSYTLRSKRSVDTVTVGQWAKLISEPGAWLCLAVRVYV